MQPEPVLMQRDTGEHRLCMSCIGQKADSCVIKSRILVASHRITILTPHHAGSHLASLTVRAYLPVCGPTQLGSSHHFGSCLWCRHNSDSNDSVDLPQRFTRVSVGKRPSSLLPSLLSCAGPIPIRRQEAIFVSSLASHSSEGRSSTRPLRDGKIYLTGEGTPSQLGQRT